MTFENTVTGQEHYQEQLSLDIERDISEDNREYRRTHPWLKFSVSFRDAPPAFWMNLGECRSKCEHIAGTPLDPGIAKCLFQLYLAKGVLATTAIEGNTLSEKEVLQHLEGKLKLPPSREYLAQEIDNIIDGCNAILQEIAKEQRPPLAAERIKSLNRTVLRKLALPDDVVAGEIRKYSVGVAAYRGAPPQDCAYLLARLCDWLNGDDFRAPKGMAVVYAILKAILAHLYLAWIHPFGDGNGRTARLVEFQILIASGVPAPAAHLLSNHYNPTRTEYYRQLHQASASGGDVLPFATYAIQGFLDGLRSQLEAIREQQWEEAWQLFVHDAFRGLSGVNQERRRELTLELSKHDGPIPTAKLRELSPGLARAYAGKTKRTLTRDIDALVDMELLRKSKEGIRAHKEIILAFLPPTADKD